MYPFRPCTTSCEHCVCVCVCVCVCACVRACVRAHACEPVTECECQDQVQKSLPLDCVRTHVSLHHSSTPFCVRSAWMLSFSICVGLKAGGLFQLVMYVSCHWCFLYALANTEIHVWRSKLYYTVCGIMTPVGGCPVHRSSLNLRTRRPPTECDDTRGCIIQFWTLDDEHMVFETCRGMK